jgi:polyhydroxybutyrate depolymerase
MRRRCGAIALIVCGLFLAIALAPTPVHATSRSGREPAQARIDPVASICSPARPHAPGSTDDTVTVSSDVSFPTRTYRLHVPSSYTGSTAVPLVFMWHGAAMSPSDMPLLELYTELSAKSDANNFIIVYPYGVTTTAYNFTHFNAWLGASPEPDDVAFATAMLAKLDSQLCIDPSHVFSTGLSNGALMSVRLACSLSSRIAAIAPVAGAYYPPAADGLNLDETCPDTRPVPIIAFHGVEDTTVPFLGGPSDFPYVSLTFRLPIDTPSSSDDDVMSDWAAHNTCTGARQQSTVSSEVYLVQYPSCASGADVELYAVIPGGHTWPGGAADLPDLGYTTRQISATDLMWSFFVAHPMPTSSAPSVGGIAQLPDAATLPSSGAAAQRLTLGVGGFAALAVAIAGGWCVRRRGRVGRR